MYFKRNQKNKFLISINQIQLSDTNALKESLAELNSRTNEYGVVLTVKQVNRLAEAVKVALRESDRVEIGAGILPVLADEFSRSIFVDQENYASLLEELVYIFFQVKTAVCDRISDNDLVRLLRDYYENKAMGSVEIMRERDIDLLVKYVETELGQNKVLVGDVYETESYTDERT